MENNLVETAKKVQEAIEFLKGQTPKKTAYMELAIAIAETALLNMTGELLDRALDVSKALVAFEWELIGKHREE